MRISLLVAQVVLLAGVAQAIAAAASLSPADITATFGAGKPFTATSNTSGKVFTFTFNADGSASQSPKGSKTAAIIGKWRVNDEGYCSSWGTNAERCYTVQKNGSRYDVVDSAGNLVSHWTL